MTQTSFTISSILSSLGSSDFFGYETRWRIDNYAVKSGDDVFLFKSGPLGGTAWLHLTDNHAARFLDSQTRCYISGNLLHNYAELTATHFPVLIDWSITLRAMFEGIDIGLQKIFNDSRSKNHQPYVP